MLAPRHAIAYLQSDYHRAKYRKTLRWLMVSLLIIFALIAAIVYLILFQPIQKYYANTPEGRIIPMIPVVVKR